MHTKHFFLFPVLVSLLSFSCTKAEHSGQGNGSQNVETKKSDADAQGDVIEAKTSKGKSQDQAYDIGEEGDEASADAYDKGKDGKDGKGGKDSSEGKDSDGGEGDTDVTDDDDDCQAPDADGKDSPGQNPGQTEGAGYSLSNNQSPNQGEADAGADGKDGGGKDGDVEPCN